MSAVTSFRLTDSNITFLQAYAQNTGKTKTAVINSMLDTIRKAKIMEEFIAMAKYYAKEEKQWAQWGMEDAL